MTEEPSDLRDREGGEVDGDPDQDPDPEQDLTQDTEQTPESEEETPRPISVRDLMPSPPSRPSRRPPERAGRPGQGAEEGEEPATQPGKAEEEAVSGGGASEEPGTAGPAGAASVPTPVRVAMDAPPPGDSRPPEELPSRRFEVDGEDWIVRVSGRTITGTRPDAGALLMHLSFHRPDEPESASRRLITVDRPLDALYQEDLLEFFQRSLPTDRGGAGSE